MCGTESIRNLGGVRFDGASTYILCQCSSLMRISTDCLSCVSYKPDPRTGLCYAAKTVKILIDDEGD